MRNVLIGAHRDSRSPKKIEYRPDEVVLIPAEEAIRFHQEYDAALSSNALIKRTKADHAAWIKAEDAKYEKIAADAKKARDEKAKADKATAEAEQRKATQAPAAPSENESAQ